MIPYLHVNGAANLIAFMKEVFDAQEIAIYPRPDGTVGHAALRIGDSVIELADAEPGVAGNAMRAASLRARHRRSLPSRAQSWSNFALEPADQFYGDRTASVRDSSGNNWYIATQIEVVSREEVDKRLAAMSQTKA